MTGTLPGWRMFSRVERMNFQLVDKNKSTLNVYDYLPKHTYIPDRKTLEDLVKFIETREPERVPLSLTFNE